MKVGMSGKCCVPRPISTIFCVKIGLRLLHIFIGSQIIQECWISVKVCRCGKCCVLIFLQIISRLLEGIAKDGFP